MRTAITTLGLLAAVGLTVRAADDDAAKKAAKDLEGTYTLISHTSGGKPETKSLEAKQVVIRNGTMTIVRPERETKLMFTLDPSKTPPEIDVSSLDGDEVVKGLYQTRNTEKGLEVTLAFTDKPGAPRPKDFKGEGERDSIIKLLRKKGK
jgi:uncharacterized protein (TIGR03067 family)